MKTDDPGFLDVKLVAVVKDAAAWIAALAAVGTCDQESEAAGWQHRRVVTSAALKDRKIRVLAYVGAPTADVVAGFVGADRILTDGIVEVPEVSLAAVPQLQGPASKETWMAALKAVLKEANAASSSTTKS